MQKIAPTDEYLSTTVTWLDQILISRNFDKYSIRSIGICFSKLVIYSNTFDVVNKSLCANKIMPLQPWHALNSFIFIAFPYKRHFN